MVRDVPGEVGDWSTFCWELVVMLVCIASVGWVYRQCKCAHIASAEGRRARKLTRGRISAVAVVRESILVVPTMILYSSPRRRFVLSNKANAILLTVHLRASSILSPPRSSPPSTNPRPPSPTLVLRITLP
eukprot:1434980-Rhodomonas_salina.1